MTNTTTHTGQYNEPMSESRWDPQPTKLGYAPPAYPSHGFKGTGTVWRVYLNSGWIGNLSFNDKGEVAWQPNLDCSDIEWEFASGVADLLRRGAKSKAPLQDTLSKIFAANKVGPPAYNVDLSELV